MESKQYRSIVQLTNSPVVKVRRMLAMVCCRVDIVLAIVVGGGRENSKVCSCRSGFTIDMSEDLLDQDGCRAC